MHRYKAIKYKYLSNGKIFFKITAPQYNKINLSSVAFQRLNSLKERVFLTKSDGRQGLIRIR